MTKDTVPVELPRDLLRQVIARRGGVQPINDRELEEVSADVIPEVLREWLDGKGQT